MLSPKRMHNVALMIILGSFLLSLLLYFCNQFVLLKNQVCSGYSSFKEVHSSKNLRMFIDLISIMKSILIKYDTLILRLQRTVNNFKYN